jgi:hypothetical protein
MTQAVVTWTGVDNSSDQVAIFVVNDISDAALMMHGSFVVAKFPPPDCCTGRTCDIAI